MACHRTTTATMTLKTSNAIDTTTTTATAIARCEPLEPRQLLAATYFVSPSGNDGGPGTQAQPWRTIARVNQVNFNPGDRVYFEGGERFTLPSAGFRNVLTNGGFESSLTGWGTSLGYSTTGSAITTTASNVRSGTRALAFNSSAESARAQNITTRIKPGRSYTLAAYAKTTSTDPADGRGYAGVRFFKNGVEIGATGIGLRTLSYGLRTFDFVAPESFDYAEAYILVEAGSSTFYVDDVTIKDTPQPLTLLSHDSGTPTAPVKIGSYGTGRAIIDAGNYTGISGTDVQGVIVQDLKVVGTWKGAQGTGANIGNGIVFGSGLPNDGKLKYMRVKRSEVSGFKWTGVRFHGRVGKSGFQDVQVTDASVHDNGDMGIYFVRTGEIENPNYAYRDVLVRNTYTYNNGGVPDKGSATGLGVHIGDAENVLVTRNISHHNGMFNHYAGGGPVGIMAIDSRRVTFSYNEAYANKSASGKDGAGLDFDAGVTDSVMEYNYTHDNDGPGLLFAHVGFARRVWRNNVVRYNVSQNDARHGDYGAIHMFGGSTLQKFEISHNTVFVSPSTRSVNSNSKIAAVRIRGAGSTVRIRNNIFQTTGGILLARSDSSSTPALLQGNAYWSSGGPFRIKWGGSTYSSLTSWRTARGQERYNGTSTGIVADPRLTNPGGGGTIGDPLRLNTLSAYRLRTDSTLRGKARRFTPITTLPAATRDYFGTTLPTSGNLDIGADEIV